MDTPTEARNVGLRQPHRHARLPQPHVYTLNAADGSDAQVVHPGGLQFVAGWQPHGTGSGTDDDNS